VTDDDQLATLITQTLKQQSAGCNRRQIKIHTFGFGVDHNPHILQTISEAGSGEYFFINSESEISTAFATALGGVLSVCIQDLTITVFPSPGVRVASVQTHFKTTRLEDGNDR
jgi:Ca-activated chloride channel homolog